MHEKAIPSLETYLLPDLREAIGTNDSVRVELACRAIDRYLTGAPNGVFSAKRDDKQGFRQRVTRYLYERRNTSEQRAVSFIMPLGDGVSALFVHRRMSLTVEATSTDMVKERFRIMCEADPQNNLKTA